MNRETSIEVLESLCDISLSTDPEVDNMYKEAIKKALTDQRSIGDVMKITDRELDRTSHLAVLYVSEYQNGRAKGTKTVCEVIKKLLEDKG